MACAICRPPQPWVPSRSWCSPARAGKPLPKAISRNRRRSIPIWPPWRGRCASEGGSARMIFLRSLAFALALVVITPPYSIVALASFPLPAQARWRIISGWPRIVLWLSRVVTGISYRVEGLEHLPNEPAIILSKHQSAWETIAFQLIFPPPGQVLKREVLWIAFF